MGHDAEQVSAVFARGRRVAEGLSQDSVGVRPTAAGREGLRQLARKDEYGGEGVLEFVPVELASSDIERVSQRTHAPVEVSVGSSPIAERVEQRESFKGALAVDGLFCSNLERCIWALLGASREEFALAARRDGGKRDAAEHRMLDTEAGG